MKKKEDLKKKSEKKSKEEKARKAAQALFEKNQLKENVLGKGKRARANRFLIDYFVMNKNSNSEFLISTSNNFNFMGVRGTYRKNLDSFYGDDFVFSALVLKSVGSKNDEFDVPTLFNLYGQHLYSPWWLPFDILYGLHYENQIFLNLEESNKGIKEGQNHLLWAQFGIERVQQIGRFDIILSYSLFSSLVATSSFNLVDKNISGFKSQAELQVVWDKRFRLGFGFSTDVLSNSKAFKLDQNSSILTFTYSAL